MGKPNKILKNIFSLSVAEIANKGLVYLGFTYLARTITPEGTGIINYAMTYMLYFGIVVNLGFSTIGTREIAKDLNSLNKYVNSILTMRFFLAVICYAALFLSVYYSSGTIEEKSALLITGLNLFVNAIQLDWVFQGTERMEILGLRQVITSVMNLAGFLIFIHSRNDAVLSIIISSSSLAINMIWLMIVYIKMYGKISFYFNKELWKKILEAAIPISFSFIFLTVLSNFNILIIKYFREAATANYEIGILSTAYKLQVLAIVPATIFQGAFFPVLSRAESIEEKKSILSKFTLLNSFIGSYIAVAGFVFAEFVIDLNFGSKYAESAYILQYLMITSMIVYFNMTKMPPLLAWKKEKAVMAAVAAAGVVNIGLNLYLIPIFGLKGAAITSIACESVYAIGLGIVFYRSVKSLFIKHFFTTGAMAVAACAAGYYLKEISGSAPLGILISFILYICLNYVFKTVTIAEIKGYLKR